MSDPRLREIELRAAAVLLPRQLSLLAAAPKRPPPVPEDFLVEGRHRAHVIGHSEVVEVPLKHRAEPAPLIPQLLVPTPLELNLELLQLGRHPLAYRVAPNDEVSPAIHATDVREPEEVECLRFALSPPSTIRRCVAPKLQQAGLRGVKLQTEFAQTLLQLAQEAFRFPAMLEPDHEVVRVADYDDISLGMAPTPAVCPQIEDVMKIDIRQQRGRRSPPAVYLSP